MDLHGNESCILYSDYKRLQMNKSLSMQCVVFALCCDKFSNKSAERVAAIQDYRGSIYSKREIQRFLLKAYDGEKSTGFSCNRL
jgi:hypothetical protein